jgi:hypothetical protein
MKDETKLSIIAIIAILILEGLAIYKGMDGTLLAGVIAIVAGLAGYESHKAITEIKS